MSRLVLLDLNLWGGEPPAEERLATLAAYLSAHPVDVVCLQEVAGAPGSSQADALGELGLSTVHHSPVQRGPRHLEGLAIATRLPLAPLPDVPLPAVPGDPPRVLQRADVTLLDDGTVVRVGNTHLAYALGAGAGRARQAEAIVEALADAPGPVVLAGDLNDVPGAPLFDVLAAGGLDDALPDDATPTYASTNPWAREEFHWDRRLDHVVVSREWRVAVGGVVLDGRKGGLASDHYGVRVELELVTARARP